MEISSVSSNSGNLAAVQPQAVRAREVENDKDKDDSASKAVAPQTAPRPTVNTSGQTVGSIINTQA